MAKFDGLEPLRCENIKGIVAPEIDPKRFGTFEKQAPERRIVVLFCDIVAGIVIHLLQTSASTHRIKKLI